MIRELEVTALYNKDYSGHDWSKICTLGEVKDRLRGIRRTV